MTAQDSIKQIQGLSCHNFRLIAGGSLILYLGPLNPQSNLTDWRLNIDTAWRLDGLDGPLLGSFDTLDCDQLEDVTTQQCLSFLRTLIGRKILTVDCASFIGDLTIRFDGDINLKTFCHATDSDAWELRHCSGLRYGVCDCSYQEWKGDADKPNA
jgi:hypothetical protein